MELQLANKNFRRITLLLFTGTFLLSSLTSWAVFFYLSTILLILVICQALPLAKRGNRNIFLILFLLGGLLLLYYHVSIQAWIVAIGSNAGLVTLFIVLPLLNFPLTYKDYEPALKSFSQKHIHNPVQLNGISSITALFLAALLNLGTLPIVMMLFKNSSEMLKAEKTLWLTVMRTYTAAFFWSPNFVAVAVVLSGLNLRWIELLPLGIILSILLLLINSLSVWVGGRRQKANSLPEQAPDRNINTETRLWQLAAVFAGLLFFMSILSLFTNWHILVIIPVVAIVFPLVLAFLQRKLPQYRRELQHYWTTSLLKIDNEIVLFGAAGFFGKALEISGFGTLVTTVLPLESIKQPSVLILAIIFMSALFAISGVHPVVTTSAIVATVKAEALGLSVLGYAFTLLAAYGFACLVSPFSGMTLTMAGLTKRSPWELSFRTNWLFMAAMSVLYALLIPLIT